MKVNFLRASYAKEAVFGPGRFDVVQDNVRTLLDVRLVKLGERELADEGRPAQTLDIGREEVSSRRWHGRAVADHGAAQKLGNVVERRDYEVRGRGVADRELEQKPLLRVALDSMRTAHRILELLVARWAGGVVHDVGLVGGGAGDVQDGEVVHLVVPGAGANNAEQT